MRPSSKCETKKQHKNAVCWEVVEGVIGVSKPQEVGECAVVEAQSGLEGRDAPPLDAASAGSP